MTRLGRANGDSPAGYDQQTSVANHPANARDMRSFVGAFLHDADIPAAPAEEILMAVGEVVANACRHGRPKRGQGQVELRCERHDHVVAIEITDDGPGFDVDEVLAGGAPDVLAQGGRGFFLMHQLMDKVDVRSDRSGTTVVLEHRLPR